MIAMTLIFDFFQNDKQFALDATSLLILGAIILVFNLPSIIILGEYYRENRNTKVIIDEAEITISKGSITKSYNFSEIESSIYHLGIYYLNRVDNGDRIHLISSDLAYWELGFNNGDRYYISNLVVDFLHDPPIVQNTKFRYRMLQTIDRSNSKVARNLKSTREKERIENLIEKFMHKSESELNDILANPSNYQAEALEAARKVLKYKTVG
jgi:hypothetical protein